MSKVSRKLKRKKKAQSLSDPLLRKAIDYFNAKDWQAADAACRELLRKNPKNHKALNVLSVVLTNKHDFAQAEQYVRKAITLNPNEAAYYSNLGLILKEQEKWEQSFHAFAKAAEKKPRDDETLYNLGTVYQALQEIEQAKDCYRKALQYNPDHIQAMCALCNLLRRNDDDREELNEIVDKMENLLTMPGIQKKEQLYFELARIHDKLAHHDRVFDFLGSANRIVREGFKYDVESEIKLFNSIKNVFNRELLSDKKGYGSDDHSPIFILGMPRSGTTLVEQILASHSQVAAGGELFFLNSVIMESPQLAVPFRVDTLKLPNYEKLHLVEGNDLHNMAVAYLAATAPLRGEKKYLTDKMPQNFIHVGMIKLLFPKSKVVHCRREPLDNALSLYMQHFKVLHPYMYTLEEIGKYYIAYHSLMEHWHRVVPGFMYDISYEKLVCNPEQETEKLLEFCDLEWEEECLSFYNLKRYIKTASEGQADQPLYTSSIERWKRHEKYLGSIIDIFQEAGLAD